MSRWFDCPMCIGYCEEEICPSSGSPYCAWCGNEVTFEEAPAALKKQMHRAGLWCEEIVVVLDDDGDRLVAPAFNSQEVYDRYIEWNSIRIDAACDQLTSLLNDDSDHGCQN